MLSIETSRTADLVHKLSILFVDDDADVRDSMARYLSRKVARVHTAKNGVDGLSSVKEQLPDLIISDIRMDGMDGLTMCRKIRETLPDLPMIIISAHNESEVLLSSIDLGITKFIVKPVDTVVLMDTINSVAQSLEKKRDQASRTQQMELILNESEYEKDSVKRYLSKYLESHHHDELPCIRHLNLPKLAVSGDFYSVAKHDDDLYVLLADGAGHGLSAVMPALQMPRIFQQQAARGFSLLSIASEINRSLHEQNFVEHFVATTLLRINTGERYIEVLNCSNPPVFIFGEDGELLHTCHSKSTALGVLGEDEFSADLERFVMTQSARIYLFTDGLPDMLHASSTELNSNELQAFFENSPRLNRFDAVASKVEKIAQYCKVDDVTFLEIHFDAGTSTLPKFELPQQAQLPYENEVPMALHQMTLLYVEDDEVTNEYMTLYLNRRMGMVYVAKNGLEGLALFKKYRPQVVITDIRMPLMDGLSMAEEIRKLDRDVPIIMTSGSDNAEDAEKMFEMGITRFHMKPLDTAKLTNTIQSCLRQASALSRLRLSASTLHDSTLASITTDKERHIVAVNPAFLRITGYSADEVIGHSPALLCSGNNAAANLQSMWRALDECGKWSGELQRQHKNGAIVSGWITANAVHGENGALSGHHFIFADLSERQMNDENMRHLTLHDSLTHLPNRMMFAEKINEFLSHARKDKGNLALVNIKIDHFIEINSVFGVHAGDEVIAVVAQRLSAYVAAADVVCRTGGVEFSVLMREVDGREAVERVVLGLFNVIGQPIEVNDQQIHLRISAGVGLFPGDGDTYEDLVRSASNAIDDAHHDGGGVYRFFDQMICQHKERQAMLKHAIKAGLQKNEFFMLYQPKFSYSLQRVVGAEALVRWTHPTAGLVSPVEFIPLAESSGDVIELSEWIIDTVCAQLAGWRQQGGPQIPVSINISPVHFWRGDLVKSLQNALQKWDISAGMLPIEVTEGVVMDTSERTLQVLGELKALGFKLSIDDFGTGYSSLRYLKDMPISELKIDRSFIIEIPEEEQSDDSSRTAITRAIIQLAAEFNLSVVAEGVETENQKNFLLRNGCDVIQGFLFSRPVSAEKFAALL